jgi:hypothetical protein
MVWLHQISLNISRLAYYANEPTLLKLVNAIMDLSANVSVTS